jgi:6-pyruvoyl-tetrahydropterin synthase
MWVVAEFEGEVNPNGILLGMDFSTVKGQFRGHIDNVYDHHLLLNAADEWAQKEPPGLCVCPGDPTTENIARWLGEWCFQTFDADGLERVRIEVWETQVNSATWEVINAGTPFDRVIS